MEKRIVKLGIVGLRRGRHVGALVWHDENVRITAVADRAPEVLAATKKMYEEAGLHDVRYFSEYEDMLKEAEIDAVYICTDKPLHTRHALMALDAGKHVLSEIPVIETEEEARLLRDAVRSHPELKYMTAENCNYWAHIKAWRKMREEGQLGEIVYAEGEYLHAGDPGKFQPYEAGTDHWRRHNPAITYLTHELGPLLYVMDDHCVSVSCMEPSAVFNPYKTPQGIENGIALFRTAKGAVIRIFIGFGAYVGFGHNFALYGTHGSLITDKTKDCYTAHTFAKMASIPGTRENFFEIPISADGGNTGEMHGGADGKMMRDFIKCIINDTEPPITVEDGIRMSLPGIIAHKSAQAGGSLLPIPDVDEL